jgi:hypothetical protein
MRGHRAEILSGEQTLPPELAAGSAPMASASFRWTAPGVDRDVLDAFNANTCNGCHGGRAAGDPLGFQHVAPAAAPGGGYYDATAAEPARLSRYLHDPGHPDELLRRARRLVETACAPACDVRGRYR